MDQLTDIIENLNNKQKSVFSDMFLSIWLSNGFGVPLARGYPVHSSWDTPNS